MSGRWTARRFQAARRRRRHRPPCRSAPYGKDRRRPRSACPEAATLPVPCTSCRSHRHSSKSDFRTGRSRYPFLPIRKSRGSDASARSSCPCTVSRSRFPSARPFPKAERRNSRFPPSATRKPSIPSTYRARSIRGTASAARRSPSAPLPESPRPACGNNNPCACRRSPYRSYLPRCHTTYRYRFPNRSVCRHCRSQRKNRHAALRRFPNRIPSGARVRPP